jgi:hypothetical protein
MERDFLVDIKLPGSNDIVKEHVTAKNDVEATIKIAMKYNARGIVPEILKFNPVVSGGSQAHA